MEPPLVMPHRDPDHPDAASLAVQWTRAQPAVAAFIRSVVPDYHDAQDVLQQTAVVVFKKFNEFDTASDFVAWAIGIARFEVLHARRAGARDHHLFNTEQVSRIADAFVAIRDDFEPMDEALDHCMKKVTGRPRTMLDLKYHDNLTASQIAEQLGMNENAVFTALSRTRSSLRKCIEQRLTEGGDA